MESSKPSKFGSLPLSTSGPLDCALTGTALLNCSYLNKGSGFDARERRDFQLTGLLPQSIQTLESQCARAYQQFKSRADDLAKNTFLTSLKEQNEVLYYRVRISSSSEQVVPEAYNIQVVARPPQRDVQHHLHANRVRGYPELLETVSPARGLLPQHQRH